MLEEHHKDPFDRLLISQSIHEDMPILSKDGVFGEYPVRVIW
jgi:PIN domain nuclease of toxin-antitoxin system